MRCAYCGKLYVGPGTPPGWCPFHTDEGQTWFCSQDHKTEYIKELGLKRKEDESSSEIAHKLEDGFHLLAEGEE